MSRLRRGTGCRAVERAKPVDARLRAGSATAHVGLVFVVGIIFVAVGALIGIFAP